MTNRDKYCEIQVYEHNREEREAIMRSLQETHDNIMRTLDLFKINKKELL